MLRQTPAGGRTRPAVVSQAAWDRYAGALAALPRLERGAVVRAVVHDEIDRDRQASIGPLLDRSRGRQWRTEAGKKRGFTEFQGVTVTWEEA